MPPPPPAGRSITSYFNKLPSTTSSPAGGPSSSSPAKPGPSSSPLSSAPSKSQTTPTSNGKRTGFLSDAARKAIEEGVAAAAKEDGPARKKLKVGDTTPGGAKVADVFLKASGAASSTSALKLPQCSSRAALQEALRPHEHKAELLKLETETLGEDWLLALQDELTKPYFISLKEFITAEQKSKKVFPPAQDIYSWSRLCPLKDVRVVIIGQDPYHDDGQAHGLAFSVRKGMRIPPSLRNIYKEMSDEVPGFVVPKHGDLTEWAKHGVLLLNTSLTVRAHEAASHANRGWESFTAAVLRVVTNRLSPSSEQHVSGANGVVFMAWGAHAQKMCAGVDAKKHLILKSAHPSPLAAARGFFGNGHFRKANEWLEERYGAGGGVDWKSLGAES